MLAVRLATCCERPIPKMLWIEHIRTNREILGEADARHCQPPGAWRIVVHDLSPFDLNVDEPSVRHKCAYVLGIDLNRSESSRWATSRGAHRRSRNWIYGISTRQRMSLSLRLDVEGPD